MKTTKLPDLFLCTLRFLHTRAHFFKGHKYSKERKMQGSN